MMSVMMMTNDEVAMLMMNIPQTMDMNTVNDDETEADDDDCDDDDYDVR